MSHSIAHGGRFQLTAFHLRLIAMFSMLCDHTYKILPWDAGFLVYLGRLAFPIFAFQLVEGYFHTHDLKKYCQRLLIFALLSEIPYNLSICLSSWINPFHQNVLWTMLLGIGVIAATEKLRRSALPRAAILTGCVLLAVLGYLAGTLAMVDYSGPGVLTILLFYYTRQVRGAHVIPLAGMIWINAFLLPGMSLSGSSAIPLQALAVVSLLFIWLYHGQQGYHSRAWSRLCYWFYPLHLVILILLFHFFLL